MKKIKKFILLSVSLILLISCLFLGTTSSGAWVAGVGMGKDLKVNNAEELAQVLKFALNNQSGESDALGLVDVECINLLSTSEANHVPSQTSDKHSNEYTSATITVISSMNSSSTSSNPKYSNGVRSSSQTFNREMTVYISEGATLYQSSGNLTTRKKIEKTERYGENNEYERTVCEQSDYILDFDMQILRTEEDTAYVNFKKFMLVENYESRQIGYANANKWIEMPYEFVESIITIDSQNRDVLKGFGDILQYLIDTGEVNEEDRAISLDINDFVRLVEVIEETPVEINDIDDREFDFTYDLTSPTTPYMSYISIYDSTDRNEKKDWYGNVTDSVTTTNKFNISNQFVIKNINNTVINFDEEDVKMKIDSEEKFNKLFAIVKRSRNDD